jgi:AcrR family transcriptional regulator
VAHALRRDAFVDATERLIASKGYEQMSIQDVLDELDASKGAFYHYFGSKQALLEAVIEQMTEAATVIMTTVVADPDLLAVAKLERLFSTLAEYKSERRELVLGLLRIWFSDGNAVVREQLRRSVAMRLAPLLAQIVQQGVDEGVFTTGSPQGAAAVLVSLLQGASETASDLFLARQLHAVSLDDVERTLGAYTEAYERILGLGRGSLHLLDASVLHLWFD